MWWVVKWAGTVASLFIAAAWLGSGFGFVQVADSSERGVAIWSGCLVVQTSRHLIPFEAPVDIGRFQDGGWHMGWCLWLMEGDRNGWIAIIPMWAPLIVVGGLTLLLWRHDTRARRRARLNQCVRCGYDRAGLVAGAPCPECGGKA